MSKGKQLYDSVRDKLDYVSTKLSNAIHDFYHEDQTDWMFDILDAQSADVAEKKQLHLDELVASGYAKTAYLQ